MSSTLLQPCCSTVSCHELPSMGLMFGFQGSGQTEGFTFPSEVIKIEGLPGFRQFGQKPESLGTTYSYIAKDLSED